MSFIGIAYRLQFLSSQQIGKPKKMKDESMPCIESSATCPIVQPHLPDFSHFVSN